MAESETAVGHVNGAAVQYRRIKAIASVRMSISIDPTSTPQARWNCCLECDPVLFRVRGERRKKKPRIKKNKDKNKKEKSNHSSPLNIYRLKTQTYTCYTFTHWPNNRVKAHSTSKDCRLLRRRDFSFTGTCTAKQCMLRSCAITPTASPAHSRLSMAGDPSTGLIWGLLTLLTLLTT